MPYNVDNGHGHITVADEHGAVVGDCIDSGGQIDITAMHLTPDLADDLAEALHAWSEQYTRGVR